ncbi:hypothetical protein [Chryseobacterium salivictor]|uniref:Plasmid stabilisation system protein n=1 Tax=Chryseobacterium salivictor TaxID=2547600 RepID=A0A4P6ZH60_9FLAO|nr:hypothetical protein [Chryseobacterium salivictor]QBO59090.1 hypothetical protein NBC122_02285 [Chryseobacterium salivictor]
MGEIIIYADSAEETLRELVDLLYDFKYFGFRNSAVEYTMKIVDFIDQNIDKPITKNSPAPFQKFGRKYLRYKVTNKTFWYIFFDEKDNRFIINHILNNHSQDFPELL